MARNFESPLPQGLAAFPVEQKNLVTLIRSVDRADFSRWRSGGIDDVDALFIGEEQRGSPAARCAGESTAIAGTVRQRSGLVPKRSPGKAHTGSDEQSFFNLG